MRAGSNPFRRKRRTSVVALACGCAALAVGAGAAGAAKNAGPGGIGALPPPAVSAVVCSERCLDLTTVAETGTIEIEGTGLAATDAVKLKASGGRLKVRPTAVSDKTVTAEVPVGAVSGRVSVLSGEVKTAAPEPIEVVPADEVTDVRGFSMQSAKAVPRKSFFNAKRKSEVSYLFKADGPADVRVDVVDKDSGEVVDSAVRKHQKPFATHSFRWNGLNESDKVAKNGDYRFEVSPLSGGAGAGAGFSYYDHIFPLRGKHGYGDGLGAGRGHQGQDVFAKCGTKIVAARGGRVQTNAYQSAAGYYVVIDGAKTGRDYVYMHMEQRGRPAAGTRVHTGDVIGYESDTGDAQGCHLHFELWSSPGWYEGGHVLNPTRPLKKWDKYS